MFFTNHHLLPFSSFPFLTPIRYLQPVHPWIAGRGWTKPFVAALGHRHFCHAEHLNFFPSCWQPWFKWRERRGLDWEQVWERKREKWWKWCSVHSLSIPLNWAWLPWGWKWTTLWQTGAVGRQGPHRRIQETPTLWPPHLETKCIPGWEVRCSPWLCTGPCTNWLPKARQRSQSLAQTGHAVMNAGSRGCGEKHGLVVAMNSGA